MRHRAARGAALAPGTAGEGRGGLARMLGWIAAGGLLANVAQVFHEAAASGALSSGIARAGLAALGAAAAGWAWPRRARWRRALTQVRFGAALLLALAIGVLAGTLVVQTPSEELFYARYGGLAPAMTWLHLNDVFRCWWFLWLLALLASGLVSSALRRKLWRPAELGFLLTHGGVVLLLLGGAVGSLLGSRGMIHLEIGETARHFTAADGSEVALPFEVGLRDFAIERREAELRLYLLEGRGDEARAVASFDVARPATHPVEGYGALELVSFAPARGGDVAATAPGQDGQRSAAALELRLHGPEAVEELLLRPGEAASLALDERERVLRLAKRPDDVVNFTATVAIADDGAPGSSRRVSVNRPLRHRGYTLYQANYDPRNPRYAGILVVRDPGLRLAYAGLAAMLLGVLHILLLRPRLRRRSGGGS